MGVGPYGPSPDVSGDVIYQGVIMAFAASNSTAESRSFAIGAGLKAQIMTFTAASGDVAGTVTASGLSTIQHILIDGALQLTAAPTFAANVATLAFQDPLATVAGTILAIGR